MPFLRENPEVLRGFREGERAALEQTYRAYVRGVDGYLRALAGRTTRLSPSMTGDLLQEAFIRAFSDGARLSYDGVRDYGPYVNTIARHCFIDWLRRQGREVPLSPDQLPEASAAQPPPLEQDYDPKVVAVLRDYLQALPQPLHAVYRHRYVLGISQEAACRELGITRRHLRTSEAQLRRGLKKALVSAGVFATPALSLSAGEVAG